MTLNGKNKILAESYFGKKKFLQIVLLKKKKKKNFILRRNCPPLLPTATKIKWSVPKSIQKQIVEYNIKSKYILKNTRSSIK